MSLVVYLAGASRESQQCAHYLNGLRENGIEISHDWLGAMRTHVRERHLLPAVRQQHLDEDMSGICAADVVWFLVPDEPTIGMWVELGIAACADGTPRTIIASGDWRKTIFTELAHEKYETHEDAFRRVCEIARKRVAMNARGGA